MHIYTNTRGMKNEHPDTKLSGLEDKYGSICDVICENKSHGGKMIILSY